MRVHVCVGECVFGCVRVCAGARMQERWCAYECALIHCAYLHELVSLLYVVHACGVWGACVYLHLPQHVQQHCHKGGTKCKARKATQPHRRRCCKREAAAARWTRSDKEQAGCALYPPQKINDQECNTRQGWQSATQATQARATYDVVLQRREVGQPQQQRIL